MKRKDVFRFVGTVLLFILAGTVLYAAGDAAAEGTGNGAWKIVGGGGGVLAAIGAIWQGIKKFAGKFSRAGGELADVVLVSMKELGDVGMAISKGVAGFKTGFVMMEELVGKDGVPSKEQSQAMFVVFKTAWEDLKRVEPEFQDAKEKIAKEVQDVTRVLRNGNNKK